MKQKSQTSYAMRKGNDNRYSVGGKKKSANIEKKSYEREQQRTINATIFG